MRCNSYHRKHDVHLCARKLYVKRKGTFYQIAQKTSQNFVKFMHTYLLADVILTTVNPPIHYIVFATP